MKVAKVNINGTPRSGAALDGIDHPQLQLKTSILVSDTVRGGGERNTVEVSDNDVCELVFADNTTWLGSLDTLEQLYPAAVKVNRDAAFTNPPNVWWEQRIPLCISFDGSWQTFFCHRRRVESHRVQAFPLI